MSVPALLRVTNQIVMAPFYESALSALWQSRSFPLPLVTTDRRNVVVVETGVPNRDGGPDFHDALIRIGGTLYRGDVELHVDARSWTTHGHGSDAHYNGVILHVACRFPGHTARTASGRIVPLLIVDIPATITPDRSVLSVPGRTALRCSAWNTSVPVSTLTRWLNRMKRERLGVKVARMEERLRDLAADRKNFLCEPEPMQPYAVEGLPPPGSAISREDVLDPSLWDQLLYEGVLEGMGYSKNRRPMLSLARSVPLTELRRFPLGDVELMEAILFGAAGLLPDSHTFRDEETVSYLTRLNDRWREVRRLVHVQVLHPADWLFFRLRPVNFPTARLAVMATLLQALFGGGGFRRHIALVRSSGTSRAQLLGACDGLFRVRPSGYWTKRFLFGPAVGTSGAMLGRGRVTELLVNTFVPLLMLHSCAFGDDRVRRAAVSLYAALPRVQENIVTLQMRTELVKGRFPLNGAADQQALLQLYTAYCRTGRCDECAIGKKGAPGR